MLNVWPLKELRCIKNTFLKPTVGPLLNFCLIFGAILWHLLESNIKHKTVVIAIIRIAWIIVRMDP